MERWQKEHIIENLATLAELTVVSTPVLAKLRSRGIITESEVEDLRVKHKHFDRSVLLYEICMTRTGGFEALLEILSEVRQRGAVKILQYAQNSTRQQDNTSDSRQDPIARFPLPLSKFKRPFKLRKEISGFMASNFQLLVLCTPDSYLTSEKLKMVNNELIVVKHGANSVSVHPSLSELSVTLTYQAQLTQETQPVTYIAIPKSIFTSSSIDSLLNPKLILITEENYDCMENFILNHHKASVVKLAVDDFRWGDLTSSCQNSLLTRSVLDQGCSKTLQSFCDQIVYEESQDKYLERFLIGQLLVAMLNEHPPVIYRHTIPPTQFYVQRKIIRRNRLDVSFLKSWDSKVDVLFLTGIEKYQLSKFGCKYHLISKCRIRALPKTVKYILGTRAELWESEFEQLCKSFDKNIHWFHGGLSGQIVWKKSRGQIAIFQDFILNSDLQTDHVYEENFLDILETYQSDPVCICDSPGMGKSVLLASLARRLKNKYESHFVIFVVFTEFVDLVKQQILQQMSLGEAVLTALSRIVSGNEFGATAFKADSRKIELMFDGLDEVAKDKVDLTVQCFKLIPNVLKSVRLFITTRPNLVKKLEREFGILSYNIKHFDKNDQIKFLCDHWHEEVLQKLRMDQPIEDLLQLEENLEKKLNVEGTKSFAKTCLERLKESLNTKEIDIAGIPLQCMLIALVFRDDGAHFADNKIQFCKEEADSRINITTIVNLYERIVEKKLEAYEKRNVQNLYKGKLDKTCIIKIHFYLSNLLLFPEWISRLKKDLLTTELYEIFVKIFTDANLKNFLDGKFPQNEIPRFGFVDSLGEDENSPHFVHRTFAEYFVAMFVVQQFQSRVMSDFHSFLSEAVLETAQIEITLSRFLKIRTSSATFKHPVICYFINSLIESSNLVQNIDLQISETEFKACTNDDLMHIFHHMDGEAQLKNIFTASENPQYLLFIAVKQASEEFVSTICNTIAQLPSGQLADATELLYIAVERGNFAIFETVVCLSNVEKYLEDIDSGSKNMLVSGLLSVCLSHSSRDDDTAVDDKVQIAKWLLSLFDDLKSANIVVFAVNFHVELMEALSESGAELDCLSILLNTNKPPDTFTKEDFVTCMSMVQIKEGIQLYI